MNEVEENLINNTNNAQEGEEAEETLSVKDRKT